MLGLKNGKQSSEEALNWINLARSAVVQGHVRPRVYLSNHSSCRHPRVPWLILGQWTRALASRFAHLNVEGVTAAHGFQGTASPLVSGMWREERIHRSFRTRLVIREFTFYKQRSRWPSGRHLGSGQQMLHLLTRFARSSITSLYEVSLSIPPPQPKITFVPLELSNALWSMGFLVGNEKYVLAQLGGWTPPPTSNRGHWEYGT